MVKKAQARFPAGNVPPLDRRSRGQAATEFLFAYGWALLLIIVGIAVLAQMGLFDLGSYVPSGTEVAGFNTFGINKYRLNGDGSLHLTILNRLEDSVTVREVRVNGVPVSSPSPALPFGMNASSTVLFSAGSGLGGNVGTSYSANVMILFDVDRGNSDHMDSGTLRGTIQP